MKRLLLAALFSTALASPVFAASTQCISNALAGGTVDAITIPLQPCGSTTTLLILTLVGTNTIAAPTLQMAGSAAQAIKTANGSNPGIGALAGAGTIVMLTNNGSQWRIVSGASPSFSGTLTVPNGGTGATTFTSNGLLVGQTTGALIATAAGTTGTVLAGNTGSPPTFQALTGLTVSSLNFGTTGLLPSAATQGAITVTGTLVAANGGTGFASYTTGDLLYASGSSALSRLNGVATGNALISGGVATAPSWGKIALASTVSGTLPVANGGTGATSYTNGQLLIGNTGTTGLDKASLTAGANITITPGAGAITISATGTLGCSPAGSAGQLLTDSGLNGCTSQSTATFAASTLTVPILAVTGAGSTGTTFGIGTSGSTGTSFAVGTALTTGTSFRLAGGPIYVANSGTGTTLVSSTGTQTNGSCVSIDSNGNHVAFGAACNSGGIAAIQVKSSNFNAVANESYCIDTTGGAVTMTLPASPSNNDQIVFVDCSSKFGTNAMTVGRNTKKIMGLSEDMTVSTNNASATLIYITANTDWRMN